MKNFLPIALIIFLCSNVHMVAQSDIYLQINHKLGTEDFAFDEVATNNIGEQFTVIRLEYYLSNVMLTHDGGIETAVENLWILVDAAETTDVYLGSFDIGMLESISFGVGVQSEYNHNDPTLFPDDHPLSPQIPSMHWGWTAGYRFVAMEGNSGVSLNQDYEIHALGDVNYKIAEVPANGTWISDVLYIGLDGDYTMALNDVSISSGLINHGETNEAADLLSNFKNFVFKEGEFTTTSIESFNELANFRIWPNPAGEVLRISIPEAIVQDANIFVLDLSGKIILTSDAQTEMEIQIRNLPRGLYQVSLEKNGKILSSRKLSVIK